MKGTGLREWSFSKLLVTEHFIALIVKPGEVSWPARLAHPWSVQVLRGLNHVFSSASRQLCRRKSKTSGSWDCFWYFWSLARTEPRTFLTSGQGSRSQSFLTHFPLLSPSLWRSHLYLWCYWCSHRGFSSILPKRFPPCLLHRSPVSCFRTLALTISPPQMPFLLSVHCQVLNTFFFLLVIHVYHKTDHFRCMVNCY